MRRILIWTSFNLGFFVVRILAFDAATSPAYAPDLVVDSMGPAHSQLSPGEAEPNKPVNYGSPIAGA
jgi:hypothetical protein